MYLKARFIAVFVILWSMMSDVWLKLTTFGGKYADERAGLRVIDKFIWSINSKLSLSLAMQGMDTCGDWRHYCLRMVIFSPTEILDDGENDPDAPARPDTDNDDAWDEYYDKYDEYLAKKRADRPWYLK